MLLVVATGPAERRDWLDLVAAAERPRGWLIDLRRRTSLPAASAATSIGRDLARAGALGPMAIVARPGAQYGLTRIVDALASDGGLRIRSFHELRAAHDWLRGVLPTS